jgi:hypothetical protein
VATSVIKLSKVVVGSLLLLEMASAQIKVGA